MNKIQKKLSKLIRNTVSFKQSIILFIKIIELTK